jgi:hypothetical protein
MATGGSWYAVCSSCFAAATAVGKGWSKATARGDYIELETVSGLLTVFVKVLYMTSLATAVVDLVAEGWMYELCVSVAEASS